MSRSYLIDAMAFFFILLLFGLVSLKYFDSSKDMIYETIGVDKIYIRGQDVTSVLNKEKIQSDFNSYELKINVSDSNKTYTNAIPILNYHGISTDTKESDDLQFKDFEEQLFALKKAGYETITLDDLYLFLRGEKELAEKSFMITFDDGRKDSYYFADPVLEQLNYTAVMFVVARYGIENENSYYLNKDELIEMKGTNRWELQSHSYSGHNTVRISQNESEPYGSFFGNKMFVEQKGRLETDEEYSDRIEIDLLRSKFLLERELGHEINSFAIPFSDFGQHESNFEDAEVISRDVYQNVYSMVFYQYKPLKNKDFKANYNDKKDDFYFVMRITVSPDTSAEELLKEIEASRQILLPYEEDYTNKYRWLKNWGRLGFGNDSIVLINNENSTTTLTYLDGSYLFGDYIFSVDVAENLNSTISLLARFTNAQNYVSCTINNDYMYIEKLESNKRMIVDRALLPESIDKNFSFSIKVDGDKVFCYVDNNLVNEATVEMPDHGGVGVRTFLYPDDSSSRTVISSVQVKENN